MLGTVGLSLCPHCYSICIFTRRSPEREWTTKTSIALLSSKTRGRRLVSRGDNPRSVIENAERMLFRRVQERKRVPPSPHSQALQIRQQCRVVIAPRDGTQARGVRTVAAVLERFVLET